MKSIFDHSLSLSLSLSEMDGNSFISRDTCGHSCSVTGAIWRPDGRYFDGDDDLINCSDNGALNFTTGEFTLEAWINAASLAANSEILCRGQHGIDGYYLRIPSNGRVYFCARCDTGTKAIYTPVNTITIAAWYHIIVVVRPLSTGLVLVNGDVVELDGGQQRAMARPGARQGGLDAGVSSADDDYVEVSVHDRVF